MPGPFLHPNAGMIQVKESVMQFRDVLCDSGAQVVLQGEPLVEFRPIALVLPCYREDLWVERIEAMSRLILLGNGGKLPSRSFRDTLSRRNRMPLAFPTLTPGMRVELQLWNDTPKQIHVSAYLIGLYAQ